VLSGSGHLSARIPGTDTFLINPRFAGVLADPRDICTVDFSGKRIAGQGPIPSESPIHAAVYRIEGTYISAIQLERACQDQLMMMSLTTVKPMADAAKGAQ
jgi:ribulose-5-phosphate 4-epimerase/fuculose-1-phosphate aldolase